jgi:hypothetical protein
MQESKVKVYFGRTRKALTATIKPLFDYVVNGGSINKLKETAAQLLEDDAIENLFKKLYSDVGVYFGRATIRDVKKGQKQLKERFDDTWISQAMESFAITTESQTIASIANTANNEALKLMEKIINAGIEEGLSIENITKNINKQFPKAWRNSSKFLADRISQTEVLKASNRATQVSAESLGIPVEKVWLTGGVSKDIRHTALFAEQRRPKGMPFDIGGEPMDRPGAGSAANVINCKCALTYEPIGFD